MKKLNLIQMATSVKALDQTSLNAIKGGLSDPPPYGNKLVESDPPPYGVSRD